MAEESSSNINGFAWFLAGLGVGALAGILYAPKSGRETREDLANSAREGSEYLRNRSKRDGGSGRHHGRQEPRAGGRRGSTWTAAVRVMDRGRAQWEEFVERGKSLVGEQGRRVSEAVDAGRQAFRSAATASPAAAGTNWRWFGSDRQPGGPERIAVALHRQRLRRLAGGCFPSHLDGVRNPPDDAPRGGLAPAGAVY